MSSFVSADGGEGGAELAACEGPPASPRSHLLAAAADAAATLGQLIRVGPQGPEGTQGLLPAQALSQVKVRGPRHLVSVLWKRQLTRLPVDVPFDDAAAAAARRQWRRTLGRVLRRVRHALNLQSD
jgi:hypothetical protein